MSFRMDWSFVVQRYDQLLEGLGMTVFLFLCAVFISLIAGTILALYRSFAPRWATWPARAYTELFRNTPLLIHLYLLYFGLPYVGIRLSLITTGILGLALQHTAFIAEIVRGGILSVSKSQIQAGMALGMRPGQIFNIVVLRPALSAVLPALTGHAVIVLQDTSLVAAIAIVDLTMAAKIIAQRGAVSFEAFVVIAIIYLILGGIVTTVGRRVERRLSIKR